MATDFLTQLLGGVDQGLSKMEQVVNSSSSQVQAGIASLQGGAASVAASASGISAAVGAHQQAVAEGETSANRLATKQAELERVMLEDRFRQDQEFQPKLEAAISASGNEEGMERVKKYMQTNTRVQAKLEEDIQKSNANPIASMFDGTLQSIQTGRATQEQLAKGISMEVATQELADRRINSMLSNEENMRKLMSERQFQSTKEVQTANLLHTKAINRQKVTESDLADLQTVYSISKDQMSVLATSLNAQLQVMNAGQNVAQSILNAQMTKMQLTSMNQSFQKEEDLTAHFQHISDIAKASGKDLPVAVMRNPGLMTSEQQGLFLTLSNRASFGTGPSAPDSYNNMAATAAFDNTVRRQKVATDQIWYDQKAGKIQEQLADPKIKPEQKLALQQELAKLPKAPTTDNEKTEAVDGYKQFASDIEKVDASPAIASGMLTLNSPVATNADGTVTTFKQLNDNGTLTLANAQLMDSLGVNWNLSGRNAATQIETRFDTMATGLQSYAKAHPEFRLTEQAVASVADDLARITKFQLATASANPAFPFSPKSIAFKGVDLGTGEASMFGGRQRVAGSVDLTNPQSMHMLLQNRVDRAIREASLASAQAAAAGTLGTVMDGKSEW